MSIPEVGQPAPDFTLPNQDGENVSLSGLKGSWVVLYFYPKASTPGCTTQACSIRDNASEYEQLGVKVFGVSPDSVADVAKFHGNQSLNFTLLADEDHAVCDQYGMWVEKSMYGNKFWGASRSTLIIDPEGIVRADFPKIQPKQHDVKVLKALRELI